MLSREIDRYSVLSIHCARTLPIVASCLRMERRRAWGYETATLPLCLLLWSRELDFETRLTMATDIGLNTVASVTSLSTPRCYTIWRGRQCYWSWTGWTWNPQTHPHSCLVQRSVDTFVGMPFNIAAMAFSLIFSRRLRVTWPVHLAFWLWRAFVQQPHGRCVWAKKRQAPEHSDPVVIFPHEWSGWMISNGTRF